MRRVIWSLAVGAALATWPALCAADDGQTADEKAASQEIARALKASGQMQDYSIGVKYKEGTAWLSGRVASKQQLSAALRIVSQTDGVEQVVNNLSVKASKPAVKRASAEARVGGRSTPLASQPSNLGARMRQSGIERTSAGTAALPMRRTQAAPMSHGVPAGYAPIEEAYEGNGGPMPAYVPGTSGGVAPASYDQPHLPGYAWPSYSAYPNYAALTYPRQYSASAWPYIGPFYPYPQVPLGWRKVTLEWDDGWWMLDFDDRGDH